MRRLSIFMFSCAMLIIAVSCSNQTFIEEEVIIGENSPYELGGTLTLPEDQTEPIPAVILVHGSGPSDRNQAVHGYQIFKDLAHGLAEEGIAVLRYDKRTYTYDQSPAPDMTTFTVEDETTTDAIEASSVLKNDTRIDSDQLYLVGHSQGGMLAPRIYDTSNTLAGIVIMAGSARPLWEIIYDQNIAALEEVDPDSTLYQLNKDKIDAELEKAKQLEQMIDQDILDETVFGLPAYYLHDMDHFDTKSYLEDADFPIFVLQGETDFQVDVDRDFGLYQELLQDNELATLKSYPNLNHFFIESKGDAVGTVEEYQKEANIDQIVIDDIADWILTNELNERGE